MTYYLVESPTRGVAVEKVGGKWKCRWTIPRTEGLHFYRVTEAILAASEIRGAYVLSVKYNPKRSIQYLDGRQA